MSDTHPNAAVATLGDATLEIRPWVDPLVDELGHDLRSHYVEQYWLGILGPSAALRVFRISLFLSGVPSPYFSNRSRILCRNALGAHMLRGTSRQFRRLLRESSPFEEHAADLLLERPHTPPLDAAHFGVEVAFQGVVERDDVDEVGPRQLCHQR